MPPNSPSSGAVVPPSGVFPSPLPSVLSSTEGAGVVFGICIGATAHSAYKAPGLSTSSGARLCGSSGANERYLNGVGRKRACSVDCSVELGDFVRIRRNGLSRIYLTTASQSMMAHSNEKGMSLTLSSLTTRRRPETSQQRAEVQPRLRGLCQATQISIRCLNVAPCRSQLV